jgi:hypothetical protein
MIATAKNYDVICFQLRNNLYSQLQSPLKKDLNRLSNDIKTFIISGEKIKAQTVSMLYLAGWLLPCGFVCLPMYLPCGIG